MSMFQERVFKSMSWLFCLAYAGLFFELPISNVTLFLLSVSCLITLNVGKLKKSISSNWPIRLMLLFYLLHIIGLLYSENLSNGLFGLEKKVTLLVFPVLLFPALQQLPALEKSKLFLRIGIITISSSLIFLIIAFLKKYFYSYALAFHPDFFASIPYVFYGIYFATGSLFLLSTLNERWDASPRKFVTLSLLVIYSLGALVIIGSKTGIISYVTGLALFLYLKLRSRKLFSLSLVAIGVALCIFLLLYPDTSNRFKVLSRNLSVLTEETLENKEEFTGLNLRLYFWKTAVSQLWRDNFLITGVGTGDGQDYLDKAYEEKKLQNYGFMHFDPHNQWVTTLVQLGIIGVIILGLVFYTAWRSSRKAGQSNFFFFAIIMLCYSFSESILEANKGVVFFALMFCLVVAVHEADSAKKLDADPDQRIGKSNGKAS